jgi:hypothetical protein
MKNITVDGIETTFTSTDRATLVLSDGTRFESSWLEPLDLDSALQEAYDQNSHVTTSVFIAQIELPDEMRSQVEHYEEFDAFVIPNTPEAIAFENKRSERTYLEMFL